MTRVRVANRRRAKLLFAVAVAYVLLAAFVLLHPFAGPDHPFSTSESTPSTAATPSTATAAAATDRATTLNEAGGGVRAVTVADAATPSTPRTKHADGEFHVTGNEFAGSGWVTKGFVPTSVTVTATYRCSNDSSVHSSNTSFRPVTTNTVGSSSNNTWSAAGYVATGCPDQGSAYDMAWVAEVFAEDGGPPPAPITVAAPRVDPPKLERPSFVTSLPRPSEISWSAKHVGTNAAIAFALLLLLGLPAEIFNATHKARHVERKRMRKHMWHVRLEERINQLPDSDLLVGFGIIGALVYAELDPHLGLNEHSALLVGALALAFIVVTGVVEAVRIPYLKRRHEVHAQLEMFPKALLIAVPLVVLSRVTGFNPGFLFGVTCGLAVTGDLLDEDEGRSIALACTILIAIAIVGWALWIPAAHAADLPNASAMAVALDTFLATLWVTGLQVVLFGLLPFRFLYGERVMQWSRTGWAVIYSAALFLFAQTLLHPQSGRWGGLSSRAIVVIATVGGLALVASIGYWLWVRRWTRRNVIQLPSDELIDLADLERSSTASTPAYSGAL